MLNHPLQLDDVFQDMIEFNMAKPSRSQTAEKRKPLGEISNRQHKPLPNHVPIMQLPRCPSTASSIANPVPRKRKRMGGVSDVRDVSPSVENQPTVIKNEISPWSCNVEVGTNVKKRARLLASTTSNRQDNLCLKGSCFTGDTVNETTTPPYGHESPPSLKFKYDKTPLKCSKKKSSKKQRSRKSPKQPKNSTENSDGLVVFNMFLKNLESFNNDVIEPTSFYTSGTNDANSDALDGFEMFLKKLENDMALRNLGSHDNEGSESNRNCSSKNHSKTSSGYSPGFSPSVTSTPQLSRLYSNSPKPPSSAGYFSKPSTNASNIFQFDVDSLYGSGSTKDMILTSDIEEGVMSSNQIRFLNAMEQRVKGGSDDGFSETVLEDHVEFGSSSLAQKMKKLHMHDYSQFLQSNLPSIENLGKPKAASSPMKKRTRRRSREIRRNMWRPWC